MIIYNCNDLITINNAYFERVNAQFHLDNKNERRPHYFSIRDPENEKIIWIIPCTTDKNNKHHKRINKTNVNSRIYKYTQFIRVFGVEQTLLFEKALPIKESDIKGVYTNKNGVKFSIDNPHVIKKLNIIALEIIPRLKSGKKFSRFQPDQSTIFKQIQKEILLEIR